MDKALLLFHIWFIGALIYGIYLSYRSGRDLARSKIANPQQSVVISWNNIFWEMLLWFYFPVVRFSVNIAVADHNRQVQSGRIK